MTEICAGYTYLPDGMSMDNHEAHAFQVEVKYRGTYPHRRNGGEPVSWYSVEHMGSSLSRARNWGWQIRRFQYQQYRFTLEEAREAAAAVVNTVKINGRTWAEWSVLWAKKQAQEESA